MYSNAVTLELIDLIYGAAGDASQWSRLLERLGEVLNGTAGSLHSQNWNSQAANVAASWNIDSDLISEYVHHYSQVNPCFAMGKHLIRNGAVNPRQALCSDQLLLASEFYNDYLHRLDAFDGVVATILEDRTNSANLTIFRPRHARPIEQAECDLVRVLMPHLQRAFQLHNRIQGLEQKGDAAADVLDRVQQGVVLLDAKGSVLLVNRTANAIFAGETALKLTRRGLTAAIPSENRRLNILIQEAISTALGQRLHSGGTMAISRGGLRHPLQLLVVPLRTKTLHLGKQIPVVAIFLADPNRKPSPDSSVFSHLYGLTRAEARLAYLLACGDSMPEAAGKLGVAPSTVRSQLKSIFAKTNTSRQSELVRLMVLTPELITQTGMVDGDVLR